MRDVVNALEQLGLTWYLTGSEALAAYGSPRQTLDTDLVIDATMESIGALAHSLEGDFRMRPDPGSDLLERVLGDLDADARARIGLDLRRRGRLRVWDQVDRAGPMSKVEEAMFVLDRMYPEMPGAHRASLRRQIEADFRAGTWHGFERPRL